MAAGPVLALPNVTAEVVASGLAWPVTFAFAPDGRIYFSELATGRVRSLVGGQVEPGELFNVTVLTNGEQGLLGIALDPDNGTWPNVNVFAYHTYLNSTLARPMNRVVRYVGDAVNPRLEVLLDGIPAGTFHNGGILGIAPDWTLFITTGDATDPANSQDNGTLAGKVLRINRDGSIPGDNPIPGSPVYSLGHRNVFGLAFHPLTGMAYVSENGPSQDDEVNLLEPGRNYGWPLVTGDADDARFVDPVVTFRRVIAPTGLAFYVGSAVPSWRDDLFLGDWSRGTLQRIDLAPPDFRVAVGNESLISVGPGGVLDVEMGPDGDLYFSTTNAILRARATLEDGVPALEPGLLFVLVAVSATVGALFIVVLLHRRQRPL